jgi:hypothetical protein
MRPRKYSEMPGVRTETMLASLCRDQTQKGIDTLIGIMTSESSRDQDRIRAVGGRPYTATAVQKMLRGG